MNEPISIERFAAADLDAVIALWQAAGVARPWNDPQRDIAFACRDAHSTLLVARRGPVVVGTSMVGEDGHRGWLYYVAVAPAEQGRGLGRRLMAAAEQWLRARGVWKVQLLIRADNATARQFYERLDYRDTQTGCMQKVIESPGSAITAVQAGRA